MAFKRVDGIKHPVMEKLFPKIVPYVFDRIEFGRIGREEYQPEVGRQWQFLVLVPTRAVDNHDNSLLGIPGCNLLKKYIHAYPIDVGQHQAIHSPIGRSECGIGVGVFLGNHCLHHGPMWLRTPASANIGNTTESRLILKHHTDRFLPREGRCFSGKRFGEFFFHSS